MLQKRLIILLSLLILLPTLIIGGMAYHFTIGNIRDERIKIVGLVAESRHEQLTNILQRANNRANAFLSEVLNKCQIAGVLDESCANSFIGDYLGTETASGALLFRRDSDIAISLGLPGVSNSNIGEFQVGQLAGVTPVSPDKTRFYYVIAKDENQPWQLLISYPTSLIQPIFVSHPDLGKSGETFLADNDGFFITAARYPAAQGNTQPISATPMQTCLNRQDTEVMDSDYRGMPVIHGFRYIPEIGGGCIMAHTDQAEALAPIRTLEKQMLATLLLFLLLTAVVSTSLARRIVKPIVRLTATARRIRDGDHSVRAEVIGHDEIAELASSFNLMTEALADAQHNLETRIEERTQALRTSEERYMLAERAVNDGIWDWNILSHEYYLSPLWNKILGYDEGELPNVESIFFELIHPDDKARASALFQRHLENKERYISEIRLRRKDGSYRWVLDRGEAIRDANDRPVRMVGSITDISERKATEAELSKYREHLEELVSMATAEVQAIVQTAVNGVISIDSGGLIRMFNPAAEKLFGWTAKEAIGKNISLLMPEPDASQHDRYIRHFLETNKAKIIGTEREVIAARKDGSRFPANLAVGHGIISENMHIFVGFVSDISQQKLAEQELRQAKEAAEAAAKTKASFLANMSHEIRTPMNTVIGFAEVALQDNSLTQDTRSHISTILSSGRHLLGVINDILDFSKIEAGKVELESVCFNLSFALQEALETIGLRASEKGLRIVLEIDPDLPKHFDGDPNRLRQVILNLVGNSVKFTDRGLISVDVKRAEGADMLHFSISDTGIGMSTEQTEKIFESFSQADATTSRRFGGTGLGTTISKQIVELMGGRIWVESSPGLGSTFHFTVHLPVSASTENCLYEIAVTHSHTYRSPRCFNVLLAEDIEANARLARLRLEQQGHQVNWVKNGAEAVAAFSESSYDLILMDLQMPIMDGIEATRRIRELEGTSGKHIPILALTASVFSQERQKSLHAGIDAIVGKPINIDELLEQMETLVPKGAGISNTGITIVSPTAISIDFSPLAMVADYKKALLTWLDPLIYADSLLNFAEQHTADAAKMAVQFAENSDNIETVRGFSHALKGAAGNLALTEIARLTSEIDACCRAGDLQTINQLFSRLDNALVNAQTAINQLQLPEKPTGTDTKSFDSRQIGDLLQELLLTLNTLNPESVEPILRQLAAHLSEADLKSIRRELDNFDFDSAESVVEQLIEKLELVNQHNGTISN